MGELWAFGICSMLKAQKKEHDPKGLKSNTRTKYGQQVSSLFPLFAIYYSPFNVFDRFVNAE